MFHTLNAEARKHGTLPTGRFQLSQTSVNILYNLLQNCWIPRKKYEFFSQPPPPPFPTKSMLKILSMLPRRAEEGLKSRQVNDVNISITEIAL